MALALGSKLGHPASDAQVDHFLAYLTAQQLHIGSYRVIVSGTRLLGACLTMVTPGRVAMAMPSPFSDDLDMSAALGAALNSARSWAASQGARLIQVLVPPDDRASTNVLGDCGFEHLAHLRYLAWSPPRRWQPPSTAATLVPCAAQHDALFRKTLAATYVDSCDCPRLVGLRGMDDVLAAHRATGLHDPGLWFLAFDDNRPIGVLLLSRVPLRQALEIVYTGVVPGARGAGYGRQLVGVAQTHTVERECDHLLLAVDEQNQFALNIYVSLGFSTTERRSAWISVIDDVE